MVNKSISPKVLVFGSLVEAWDSKRELWVLCRVIKIRKGEISLEGMEGSITGKTWLLTHEQIMNTDRYKKFDR